MPSGTYATTTMLQAIQAVSSRLEDPSCVRWASLEIGAYLTEALRVWNALTRSFRAQSILTTDLTSVFIDLPSQIPALVGYTVLDQNLISEIEYGLMEPQAFVTWSGSEQFSLDQIVTALQRRRDQFLLETGQVVTHRVIPASAPPYSRIDLPEAIMTLRRVGWIDSDVARTQTPLHRTDEWGAGSYRPDWVQQPGSPLGYSTGVTPPLHLQIFPPPLAGGTLDLLSIDRGAVLVPSTGMILGVPDDWAWVVKYGALADLLAQDGLSCDPPRAAYCEGRWQQGVDLAKGTARVLAARIADQVCQVGAVSDADTYRPSWVTELGLGPDTVLLSGLTILAVTPCRPTGVPWSITLDLVRNAPIPPTTADYLQVGPELLDTLYDYAEHLALFKDGAASLTQAQPLLERFFRAAGVTLKLKTAESPNRASLEGRTTQDERTLERTAV